MHKKWQMNHWASICLMLPHFNVLWDLFLNRHTTLNLSVFYTKATKIAIYM